MIDPATMSGIGALASGAGALMAGFGSRRDRDPTESAAYWQNRADQIEFAKSGIQWRVEDARAAGLHPLYALSGGGAAYAPQAMTVGADDSAQRRGQALERMGQNLTRAAQAQADPVTREVNQAQLEVLRSQTARNYAEEAAFHSQAARNYQEAFQSRPIPMPGLRMPPAIAPADIGKFAGRVQVKPDDVVSARPDDVSVTAGTHPGMREYGITPYGLKIRLPYSDEGPSEALENIPWYMWPAMVQHNRSYYGDDWGMRFIKEFVLGKPPKYRQAESIKSESRWDNPVVRKYKPRR